MIAFSLRLLLPLRFLLYCDPDTTVCWPVFVHPSLADWTIKQLASQATDSVGRGKEIIFLLLLLESNFASWSYWITRSFNHLQSFMSQLLLLVHASKCNRPINVSHWLSISDSIYFLLFLYELDRSNFSCLLLLPLILHNCVHHTLH